MSAKTEAVKNRELELGWAVLVLIVNFVLFASHAWALGSGLPSDVTQPVVHCAYYDASKDQDPTPFATERECQATHSQCVKSCTVTAYSCVAQCNHADGKTGREAGFSQISNADARFRASAACLAAGAQNCQVLKCTENKRDVPAI